MNEPILIKAKAIEQRAADGCVTVEVDTVTGKLQMFVYPEQIVAELQQRKTGRWIETEGLEEEIRCTMCTNPMRSDRGCDGSCRYDEKLYKQIMSIIEDRID